MIIYLKTPSEIQKTYLSTGDFTNLKKILAELAYLFPFGLNIHGLAYSKVFNLLSRVVDK